MTLTNTDVSIVLEREGDGKELGGVLKGRRETCKVQWRSTETLYSGGGGKH